ncbi:PAS domain-containing protein [Cupriavidus lacunae]|nr:PAS domain-containing protein [Cupriavidus lacunae]
MNDFSRESLQCTLNLIPAHIWYADPSISLTFLNERSADYLGLAKDHPLRFGIETGAARDSHLAFLHPDDRETARKVWSECVRSGSAGEVTFRIRNAEGGYRWFVSRAEPRRADDGTLCGWIGINLDIEDRQRAEFYLAQGQRLAHIGSWAFNAGGFEYWSAGLFQIHGLEPGGKAPSTPEYMALVHPDDRDFVAHEMQKMLAEHRGFDFTKRIVRPDGAVRHIRCVGTPVPEGGTFRGFVGTGMDVTEQEQLTQALRKSEEELRQIVDLAPQHVGVLGPNGERLYANRTALAYLGIRLDDRLHATIGSHVHPDDRERLIAFASRLSVGSVPELELRLRKHDGSYRWFLARYNPVCDERGRLLRWYVACTDIEERKRAEERLQQENVALREEIDKTSVFEEIVGTSPALTVVLARVSKVAASDSTVLITGETGTGKELVARAIHRRSRRSSKAFVAVNCAAIPRELIASELFGHEKGGLHRCHPPATRPLRTRRRRNDLPG